ncbi:MAG TPA: hypothetical protein VNO24_05395, partial [Blastocatellia bacterium]|nr:hypothetical protein [Blastocatellia bacterium]
FKMENKMAKKAPVEGKVATIINERELAINIGSNAGVQEKMTFKVLAATPLEIRDPETNEVLGIVEQEKVRVKAIEVRERLTICKTYRSRTIPGGPLSRIVDPTYLLLAPERTIPETLKASIESKLPPLSEEESYVKIGDRVVEVSDPDA